MHEWAGCVWRVDGPWIEQEKASCINQEEKKNPFYFLTDLFFWAFIVELASIKLILWCEIFVDTTTRWWDYRLFYILYNEYILLIQGNKQF